MVSIRGPFLDVRSPAFFDQYALLKISISCALEHGYGSLIGSLEAFCYKDQFGVRLASRGDRVIATACSIDSMIQGLPNSPNLYVFLLDITSSPKTIQEVVEEATGKWGTIDVLVNNAGVRLV